MARVKKTIHMEITKEVMQSAFAQYAKLDARERKIQADIDLSIVKIREKYHGELSKIATDKEVNFSKLQSYALENPNLFSTKKAWKPRTAL